MKLIHTKFLSRKEAEGISKQARERGALPSFPLIPFDAKVALVSLVSPVGFGGAPVSEPELDGYWHKVLRLRFDDVDPSHCSAEIAKQYHIFDEDDAKAIIKFLLTVESEVDEVWTHCEAGVSRSAAVAKFIAYAYGSHFPETYTLYNKHVFSTLKRAHDIIMFAGGPYPGEALHERS